jgi:ketol-acid reductoisomerase
MKTITEKDIKGDPLRGKTVAVIGYGSQGEAQALNVRDSGIRVVVGLKPGSSSSSRAEQAGFDVLSPKEAVAAGDVVALLVPDGLMTKLMAKVVEPSAREGAALVFAHGYPLRFGGAQPPSGVDVVMVAPMGPGLRLRERFLEGSGLPASFSVERDVTGNARQIALGYARAMGCARIGLFETTASEETEIDLFAEQAVLCGGVTRLITAGFDTLVEAGYDPALAYIECLYELDLTVNLIQRFGISGMRQRISSTALFGDLTRGERVVGRDVRAHMREILDEIRKGTFATEMESDEAEGSPVLREALAKEGERLIEEVGKELAGVVHEVPDTETA